MDLIKMEIRPLFPIYNVVGTEEKIQELQNEMLEMNETAQTIQATADAEKRQLTEDEEKEINYCFDRFEEIKAEIDRRRQIAANSQAMLDPQGRQTDPQVPEPQASGDDGEGDEPDPRQAIARRPQAMKPKARRPYVEFPQDKGKWGWKNFGDFAVAVRSGSSRSNPQYDPRLLNAPTTYSQEGIGSEGGFAVPPEFRADIWQKVSGEGTILSMTDQQFTTKNSQTFPKDETTAWDASGGIQAYWEAEASQLTQSKLSLEGETVRLNKLTALVPVTEELMEDAPGLDGYLRNKVGAKFDFKTVMAFLQGTGAGQPLGGLNAPSKVSVAKRTGQGADTIIFENILDMWSRMYAPCRSKAVWHISQDIEPQLHSMEFPVGTGGVPVYLPAGGLSASPYATLYGRPIMPTQACNTLGDQGDINLVDWSQYLTLTKINGGLRADVSMHLWFDYDVRAYRFILRIGGAPWWKSYITPRGSTNYLSWFVTLDERA
jgi:HK97 family phage major capsid protein